MITKDRKYRTLKIIGSEFDKVDDEIYNLVQLLDSPEAKEILVNIKDYLWVVQEKIDDLMED
ncbi:hypothetical protein KF134_1504 [Lactococcus lactis subsp. lactis]|uniref:hypothetical protein n=1 Tax=Lactococcus lactis TaxID=1358 RepID=UPI000727135C|nr:hypothetical protein [Lactococcus lactis]KST91354.1 hypothetical protein KF134_1504 [Lactococcus lactis subsp. lactis]